ncbi:FecR domain-containing protein [Leptospira sp. 'Mane']|uniref:FecR domain-containing protein n=1 Tax=Leptospira sp. 'Mane' TaxID=3387407 RepID=UPI00398AD0E1
MFTQSSFRFYLLSFFLLFFTLTINSQTKEEDPKKDGITITVEKGQTLSMISKTYLDDPRKWKELLKSNKIDNPNLILPGMKLWVPASLGKKPIAEVSRLTGAAEVLLSSKKETSWSGASLGTGLYLHDEARTKEESLLELLLNTGSSLELSPNSHIVMEKVKNEKDPDSFYLKKGRMRAIITKGIPTRKMFILRTPAAIAEVKGTEFITESDEKENTSLSCFEGRVDVSAQNVTVIVNAGYATFVEKGKPPTKPFLIPAAPEIQP